MADRSSPRRGKRILAAAVCGAAVSIAWIAASIPDPTKAHSSARREDVTRGIAPVTPSTALRPGAELATSIERHLEAARTAFAASDEAQAEDEVARASEVQRAVRALEQAEARPARALDGMRHALYCRALVLLGNGRNEAEKRAVASARLGAAREDFERAIRPDEGTPVMREEGREHGALTARHSAALRVSPIARGRIDIEADGAAAEDLLAEIAAALGWTSSSIGAPIARFEWTMRAEAVEAERAFHDVAGALGLRKIERAEDETDPAMEIGFVPWTERPEGRERELMLRRTLAAALALEVSALSEPERGGARWLRARCFEELSDLDTALEEFAALVRISPTDAHVPDALQRTAEIYARRGEVDRAHAAWERLIELHPDAPSAQLALLRSADLLLERGLVSPARDRFERVLRGRPPEQLERAARLGRLECRFAEELERGSPARLQLLSAELAGESAERRDPDLRARYLRLSSALLRRAGASPLALRESLAALDAAAIERDAHRGTAAIAAAGLALEMRLPLAALCALDLGEGVRDAEPLQELRRAARDLLGLDSEAQELDSQPLSGATHRNTSPGLPEIDRLRAARALASSEDAACARVALDSLASEAADEAVAARARSGARLEAALLRLERRMSSLSAHR